MNAYEPLVVSENAYSHLYISNLRASKLRCGGPLPASANHVRCPLHEADGVLPIQVGWISSAGHGFSPSYCELKPLPKKTMSIVQ